MGVDGSYAVSTQLEAGQLPLGKHCRRDDLNH